MSEKLFVAKPYFPPKAKLFKYIDGIYENSTLTNNGPLVKELTERLRDKFKAKYLLLTNNGTSALLLAFKIKNIVDTKVISTPYTFAATSTAIKWQGAEVVYSDIDDLSWNLSPSSTRKILNEEKIAAIVPVNLFGMPCDLDEFQLISNEFSVPLIYDSAHSLTSTYKGKSVFNYGDIHCISFHATKLFHCVEGGALIFNEESDYLRAKKLLNFGIDDNGDIFEPGINAKMSELHAAMGLCVLDDLEELILEREVLKNAYKEELHSVVQFQMSVYDSMEQPIYMPVRFNDVHTVTRVEKALNSQNIFPRRYFLPQHFKFLAEYEQESFKRCSSLANYILCLPLYNGLKVDDVKRISNIIKANI